VPETAPKVIVVPLIEPLTIAAVGQAEKVRD
jgi:hypothetical protein